MFLQLMLQLQLKSKINTHTMSRRRFLRDAPMHLRPHSALASQTSFSIPPAAHQSFVVTSHFQFSARQSLAALMLMIFLSLRFIETVYSP
jgi:hypothetical protein